jgi:hypothetical protein
MTKYCCDMMTEQIEGHPARGRQRYHDPDVLIQYEPKFDEYGIIVHDGGESCVGIQFCPWCGTRLPESKRDLWFDTLERLGLDPLYSDIPIEYQSEEWWTKLGDDREPPRSSPK